MAKIKSITISKNEDVYDLSVPGNVNFYANRILVHNCVEIGMYPKTRDGRSGFQGCNLTEINGKWCDTRENFKKACEAAAIIGTLQAGYTNFKYLTKESKEIFDEEALLGVSITGMMDNPELLFDEAIQREAAIYIKDVNEKVAAMLGIKPAARTTCVKPAGCLSTEQVIRTSDGNKTILQIFEEQGYSREMLETMNGEWLQLKTPVMVFNENNELERVSQLYVNGLSETYQIPMEDGTIFNATAFHKFKLKDGTWKRTDELCAGDEIISY
jgi:hypothetical protein